MSINDILRLITVKRCKNVDLELQKAFSNYTKLVDFADETKILFWYWFIGLIDEDGHLRSNQKNTEIVVTMRLTVINFSIKWYPMLKIRKQTVLFSFKGIVSCKL